MVAVCVWAGVFVLLMLLRASSGGINSLGNAVRYPTGDLNKAPNALLCKALVVGGWCGVLVGVLGVDIPGVMRHKAILRPRQPWG